MKLPGRIQKVEIIECSEAAPGDRQRFLSLHRLKVVNTYSDGTRSDAYTYDGVLRKFLDAVVLILIAEIDRLESICLRSCVRPPLLLREGLELPQPDDRSFSSLLELPAGLIEDDDLGREGLARRAAAEALEETGYRVSPHDFVVLGPAPFVSPGVIPERIHFLTARLPDVSDRTPPKGDGSPAEEGGGILWVPLDEALAMCERGDIVDMKTELGLRRLESARPTDPE